MPGVNTGYAGQQIQTDRREEKTRRTRRRRRRIEPESRSIRLDIRLIPELARAPISVIPTMTLIGRAVAQTSVPTIGKSGQIRN